MDFFEAQIQARRRSGALVFLFALGVLGTIGGVYLAFTLTLLGGLAGPGSIWSWERLLWVGLLVGAIIGIGSLWRLLRLKAESGPAIAMRLGGRRVNPASTDPRERRALNVVEEMAIASGLPVPPLYILDDEDAINAFAAGHTTSDAAIGLSNGAVRYLNRAELQGVMGHEFSHILFGDMALNLKLIGWLHGLYIITRLGQMMIRGGAHSGSSRRSRRGSGRAALFGLGVLAAGSLGWLIGGLIKAAISRQREFLADAAAVQFTRNRAGIIGALKKIGGLRAGGRLNTGQAAEVSHMLFALGANRFGEFWATHPPMEKRVRALDPSFDGTFARVTAPSPLEGGHGTEFISPEARASSTPLPGPARVAESTPSRASATPKNEDLHTRAARTAQAIIPLTVLLMDNEHIPEVREMLSDEEVHTLRNLQVAGTPGDRVRLVQIAAGTLRGPLDNLQERLAERLDQLVHADGTVSFDEWLVAGLLVRLMRGLDVQGRELTSLHTVGAHLSIVLSELARAGAPGRAGQAFAETTGGLDLPYLAYRPEFRPEAMTAALNTLARLAPKPKREALRLCARSVDLDERRTPREREMVELIKLWLDVPSTTALD